METAGTKLVLVVDEEGSWFESVDTHDEMKIFVTIESSVHILGSVKKHTRYYEVLR